MCLRSWLFVPGDSDRKLANADRAGSDALILDLEDSVARGKKEEARLKVRDFLQSRPVRGRRTELWVRINPLDDSALLDLATIVAGAPNGIVLPKIAGLADVHRLNHHLEALEVRDGLVPGQLRILAIATETASATLELASFASARLPRLSGLTWGAEDLSAAIGASSNVDENGELTLTYQWARSAMLLAAKACNVQAIETVYTNYKDQVGLRKSCRSAARDGFTGRIAIHVDQVEAINESFAPSEEDVSRARRILKAFESDAGAGTVGLDGKMLDIPHLKQARQILEAYDRIEKAKTAKNKA